MKKINVFISAIGIIIMSACGSQATATPVTTNTPTKISPTATSTPTSSPTPIPLPPVISASNAINLQEDFRIGPGAVSDAVWLPDGNVILAYSTGVSIYNPDTGDLIKSVEPENKAIGPSIISPDGKRVAVLINKDNKVLVWDADTGKIEYELETRCQVYNFFGQEIAFNSDGSQLAVCDEEGVSLWDLSNGTKIHVFKMKRKDHLSIVFNPKNNTLATAGSAFTFTDIAIWDLTSGEVIKNLPQLSSWIAWNIRFNHQGNILAWGAPGKLFEGPKITLHDINTNQGQTIFAGGFAVFEFSPDDTTLTFGSVYGKGARLLDVATGEYVTEPKNNAAPARLIKYSPDGSQFIAGWNDFSVFRDVGSTELKRLGTFLDYTQIAFDPNGKYIAANGDFVTLWDLQTKKPALEHVFASGNNFLFTPNGDGLITNAWKNDSWWAGIQQWDFNTENQQNFDGTVADSSIVNIPPLFSPSGDLLAIGIPLDATRENGTYIRFWDANSKKILFDIKLSYLSDYEFSPDGKIFVSAGKKTITIWDLYTQTPSKQFESPKDVYDISFSPDGALIAAAAVNGVYVWDINSGELISEFNDLKELRSPTSSTRQVVFSPQGNMLAAIGYDEDSHKILFVWDLSSNNLLYKIVGDQDNNAYRGSGRAGLLFSPGGSFIVTSGLKRDKGYEYIQFWDTSSGQLIKTLGYMVGSLSSPYANRFGFSPDGRIFAVADGTVHVLHIGASSDNGNEDILPTSIPILPPLPLPTATPQPAPAWDFNQNGNLEGWQAQNQLNPLQIRSENLVTESTGNDPFMVSPTIRLDASAFSHIEVRMKVSAGNTADLYFSTNSESGYDESKVVHFPITSDGQFQTYILDMSNVKKWGGEITQIRFDPTNTQADIEIDYIHILSSAMPNTAPAWDFNQNDVSEGWNAKNQLNPLRISAGSLVTKSTGDDPFMISPTIRLDASAFSHVEIRMKVSAGNTADIYFITNSESGYDESKAIHYPITSDGQFHTYTFSMANVKKWSGEITQIRFDPTNAQADIEIDYIHILP